MPNIKKAGRKERGWTSIVKKQTLVTTSTYASESAALSSIVDEVLWLKNSLEKLGIETIGTSEILEDNRGVVLSVNRTGNSPINNMYVDIKEKHVQDRLQTGEIVVQLVGSEDKVADALTKGLTRIPFGRHFPHPEMGSL